MSHLSVLRESYPDYNWPEQGERGNYPEELGAMMGEIRRFGFLGRKYRLIFRSSSEKSAIEFIATKGKKALITYNPIRLEIYGVWAKV